MQHIYDIYNRKAPKVSLTRRPHDLNPGEMNPRTQEVGYKMHTEVGPNSPHVANLHSSTPTIPIRTFQGAICRSIGTEARFWNETKQSREAGFNVRYLSSDPQGNINANLNNSQHIVPFFGDLNKRRSTNIIASTQ